MQNFTFISVWSNIKRNRGFPGWVWRRPVGQFDVMNHWLPLWDTQGEQRKLGEQQRRQAIVASTLLDNNYFPPFWLGCLLLPSSAPVLFPLKMSSLFCLQSLCHNHGGFPTETHLIILHNTTGGKTMQTSCLTTDFPLQNVTPTSAPSN